MQKTILSISLTAMLALGACSTSLESRRVSANNFTGVGSGATYFLPQQALRIAVTYEVRSCTAGKADIRRSAVITAQNRPDDNARFAVSTSALASRFKTTSLTVGTYDDGTLQSLGATADDRSAEIIGGVVGTGASIARIAIGAGSSAAACSVNTSAHVTARDMLINQLRDPTVLKDEDDRAAAVDQLARLNASLQMVRNITYVPNASATDSWDRVSRSFDTSETTKEILERWLDNNDANYASNITNLQKTTVCIRPILSGEPTISTDHRDCGASKLVNVDVGMASPPSGIVYRDPRRILVVVCQDKCTETVDDDGVIGRAVHSVVQLGTWRTIKLESKAFQDRNAMATWARTGQLTSLTIGASSSIEALASALNTSASTAREGQYSKPDLIAPGFNVYTIARDGRYLKSNGSSNAAPIVSGLASLFLEVEPRLTPQRLRSKIIKSCKQVSGESSRQGAGLIQFPISSNHMA